MPAEQPIEQQARIAVAAGFFGARNRQQRVVAGRVVRPAAPIPNAIQADVRGDPVQQARGIPRIEPSAPLDDPDEDVLTGVERVFFSSKQLAAPSQHHRTVTAAERADVQLVFHAMGITPAEERSVTRCWRG